MPAPSTQPHPNADAMQRRLAQLSQAMGDGEFTPRAQRPFVPDPSLQPLASQPPVAARGRPPLQRRKTPGVWWAVGSLVPVIGTWLVLHQDGTTAAPPPRAVAASVTHQPLPVPPTIPAEAQTTTPHADEEAVRHMLERWRLDWSRRDVPAYLGHYSASFVAADGMNRRQWEAARRRNLLNRSAIRVELSDLRLEREGATHVRAQVLQTYLSASYVETAQPKTLRLAREDGRWRIVGEWHGSGPGRAAAKP